MKKVSLQNLNDAEALAQHIAREFRGGEIIALVGPLGSGKTTFVQALARALGIKKPVKSPTFIVLQTFQFKKNKRKLMLCHIDAYRLHNINELEALGLQDYLGQPNTVIVVEWADKIKSALPRETTWLKFQYAKRGRIAILTGA